VSDHHKLYSIMYETNDGIISIINQSIWMLIQLRELLYALTWKPLIVNFCDEHEYQGKYELYSQIIFMPTPCHQFRMGANHGSLNNS